MLADRIDSATLKELAADRATQAGWFGPQQLPRLAEWLIGDGAAGMDVRLEFAPAEKGLARLELSVRGQLQLVCQRCLGPLDWPVDLHANLTVVADDSDADLLEDPFESVALEADLLRIDRIVEDEVLAAVPIAPRHGSDKACSGPAPSASSSRQDDAGGVSRPFAELAAMLKAGQRRADQ